MEIITSLTKLTVNLDNLFVLYSSHNNKFVCLETKNTKLS